MWGSTDRNDAIDAIRAAYDEGMTAIDTAPIYGQGESEEITGEAIKGIPRDKVQLLTKFGMRWDLDKGEAVMSSLDNTGKPIEIYRYAGKESVIYECEQSLKRLGTDYIDLYQIHWNDSTTPVAESMEALLRLIEQGKVRYAGVCNYDAELMEEAAQTIDLASNQIPFSMINRKTEKETIPYCIRHGKSVLAYSPLERGLLTGKILPGHHFAEGDHRAKHRAYTEENIIRTNRFLDKLRPLAESKHATLSQLVLRWTIEQPGITVALAGARNRKQAVENARAAEVKLSGEEITYINELLEQR